MRPQEDLRTVLGRGAVVAGAGVVTILLVLWAAAVPRPARVIARPTASFTTDPKAPLDQQLAPQTEFDAAPFAGPRRSGTVLDQLLGYGAGALVALAVLVLVVILLRHLLAAWRERGVVEADDATGPGVDRLAAAVVSDAAARLTALSAGTPAEGIVAAWTHLEATLRDAGLKLPSSRVSSETTVAALGRYVVDAAALQDLAALYREARWSRHPLTEDDRARAQSALRSLDAQLASARTAVAGRG